MFWDKIAGLYDLFENIYNRSVYSATGKCVASFVSENDLVLECACGIGGISRFIAPVCKKLIATDYSTGMLHEAKRKLAAFSNVSVKKADITALKVKDNSFDIVVVGNVIHLLPEPEKAMEELFRVCKDGGKLIIPTYINASSGSNPWAVRFLELLGANFKRQFSEESYRAFFEAMDYQDVCYEIVKGRMACDIAVIPVKKVLGFCHEEVKKISAP